ncbi:MAG: hypothetical protein K9G33_02845 [Sneathiella sp.]|nr:hypothetical protein [Sneathiella sp.]
MNEKFQGDLPRHVTLAEIERGIREGQRLRSEEIQRLGACFNALIRKGFTQSGRYLRQAGAVLVTAVERRMEVLASRHTRARVHYD